MRRRQMRRCRAAKKQTEKRRFKHEEWELTGRWGHRGSVGNYLLSFTKKWLQEHTEYSGLHLRFGPHQQTKWSESRRRRSVSAPGRWPVCCKFPSVLTTRKVHLVLPADAASDINVSVTSQKFMEISRGFNHTTVSASCPTVCQLSASSFYFMFFLCVWTNGKSHLIIVCLVNATSDEQQH